MDCGIRAVQILTHDAATATKRGRPNSLESGMGKMEHHRLAKCVCIESPDRKRYVVRSVNHFVREHPELFLPEDVMWRRDGHRETCRATAGLHDIFLTRKGRSGPPEHWKGWRAVWKKDRLGAIEWER